MAATAQRLMVKEYPLTERVGGPAGRRLERRVERIDPLDTKAGLFVASVSLLLTTVLPAHSFSQGLSAAMAVGTAASLICLSAAVSAYAVGRNPRRRKVHSGIEHPPVKCGEAVAGPQRARNSSSAC